MFIELADGTQIPVYTDGFVQLVNGIEVQIPEGAQPGDSWEICVFPYREQNPLSHATLSDSVFVSNNQRLLSEIKSNLVQTHRDTRETEGWNDLPSKATYDFRSAKLAVHHNHIFPARGRTLHWTDLDHVWNWYPRPTNEADFRTIEWESEDITAVVEINDTLFVHFPTAVYSCEYLGKPTIVRINQRNEGHGAVAQNAITTHRNSQFYMGVDNFYQWSPAEGIHPIGEEIWKRIIQPDIASIITYVDRVNKEIHWVIGEHIWAFNYIERHWSRYSSNSVLSHTTLPINATTSLQDALDESSSVVERSHVKGLYNLWCKEDGLYRSFEAGDDLARVVGRDNGFLVSDEQTYGDIFGEKMVDKVVVDGSYGVGMDGLIISVSAKRYVSDPDTYKVLDQWRHERQFKQGDGKQLSGRSLKFKFEVRDKVAKWDGKYLSEGHTFVEGLEVSAWNGAVTLDGGTQYRYLHMGLWDGGTTYMNGQMRLDIGQFMLYAWGERVVLPLSAIGEDK